MEIDQINKPFLPVAAGRISPRFAWALVLGSGAAGLAVVKATFSPLIFWLYLFGTTVGGLYSVPPFQASRAPCPRASLPPPLSVCRLCPCPMAPPPRRAACGVVRKLKRLPPAV